MSLPLPFMMISIQDMMKVVSDTFSWETYDLIKDFFAVVVWGEDDNALTDETPADAAAAPADAAAAPAAAQDEPLAVVTVVPAATEAQSS